MLKNFTVIEVTKKIPTPWLIIEPARLRHTRGTVEALEYAPFVHYLVDAKDKRLAVQVSKEKDKQALRFSKPQEEQKALAVLVQNAELMETIHNLCPDLEAGGKYRVAGTYSKEDKAVIFDLKKLEPYVRFHKGEEDAG